MPTWLVICASPRAHGSSAKVADALCAHAQGLSDVHVERFDVARASIRGCDGCGACERTGACIHEDDMAPLMDKIAQADRVLFVSPIYFAGLPSQAKALLDRLQPHFHRRQELKAKGEPLPEKRPLDLYLLGDGGDPHGWEPAAVSVRSAFALADLRLEHTQALIGETNPADPRSLYLPEA